MMKSDNLRALSIFKVTTDGFTHLFRKFGERVSLRENRWAQGSSHETALWRLFDREDDLGHFCPPYSSNRAMLIISEANV